MVVAQSSGTGGDERAVVLAEALGHRVEGGAVMAADLRILTGHRLEHRRPVGEVELRSDEVVLDLAAAQVGHEVGESFGGELALETGPLGQVGEVLRIPAHRLGPRLELLDEHRSEVAAVGRRLEDRGELGDVGLDALEDLVGLEDASRDLGTPVVSGEVAEDDALGTDVDERGVEVGDVGSGPEELLRRLLQPLALEHAHLHAELGPVLGAAGRRDEVIEAVVVDVGGEAVERGAHTQEHLDRPRPVVEVAPGVELRLREHRLDGGDEVGQGAAEAFGDGARGFGLVDGFEVGAEPHGVLDVEGEGPEGCEFAELAAQGAAAVVAGLEDVAAEAHSGLWGVIAGGELREVLHRLVDGDVPRLASAVERGDVVGQHRPLVVELAEQPGEVRAFGPFG
ncbi:Uncharacterised protein [Mycobacteroides abscessus subsp. abscessus]|nr:Uncharacterised protein [Mycobacteroides abscessus subsp. abscessus]